MPEPDIYDEEDFRDHFVALRRHRSRWSGRIAWAFAHCLALVAAVGAIVWFFAASGVVVGVMYSIGLSSPTTSDEDVELMKDSVPWALKLVGLSTATLLVSCVALGALLRAVAPNVPALPISGGPKRRARRRETRREFQTRAARESRVAFLVLGVVAVAAGTAISVLLSFAPWEADASVMGAVGRLVLLLLAGAAATLVAIAVVVGVAGLALLVGMVAGWIRAGFASRLLPQPEAATGAATDEQPVQLREDLPAAPASAVSSPSLLVYLFADRLLPNDTMLRLGAPIPCSDAEVKMNDLAATTLAAAFWSLRRRGSIRLAESRRGKLLRRRRIDVMRLRSERALGLEDVVMRVPNVDPDAFVDEDTSGRPGPLGHIREVVGGWLGALEDPEWKVIEEVLTEAEARGVARRDEKEGDRGDRYIECAGVEEQRPAFVEFEVAWRASLESEPALHRLLLRECRKAISGARVYPEGSLWQTALGFVFRAHDRATRPWPKSPTTAE
jgi:hypothetical protein